MIENYYFVKRRIQFILKISSKSTNIGHRQPPTRKNRRGSVDQRRRRRRKREEKKSREGKRRKRKKRNTWSTISQLRRIPRKMEKVAGARKRKGGHGARGWDYVIKAVTVHRTVIQNRAQLVCTRRVTPVPGSCTCVIVVIPALSIRVPRSPEITRIRKHTTCGRARTRSACARAANEPPLIYKLPINRLWVADEIGYQLIYILLSLSLSLSLSLRVFASSRFVHPLWNVQPVLCTPCVDRRTGLAGGRAFKRTREERREGGWSISIVRCLDCSIYEVQVVV